MAPTLSDRRGGRPDPTARRWKPPLQNRLLIRTLRSPLHRLLDGFTVALRVTGIVTGTMHELPVMFAWENSSELVVYPGRPETKKWWRNLRRRTAVSLLHGGRWHQASGEVLQPGDDGYDGAVRAYHRRWPHVRIGPSDPLVRLRLIEAEPDPPGGDTSRVSRRNVRAGPTRLEAR
ncbi:MAG TPA: nitroreductase/quinone reductase family protein [Microlunatus sp.]